MGFENMQKEFAAHVAASDTANAIAMNDNFKATETFQHKRRMEALGMGLKACLDSGLTRAEIHELVDAAFNDAGKA